MGAQRPKLHVLWEPSANYANTVKPFERPVFQKGDLPNANTFGPPFERPVSQKTIQRKLYGQHYSYYVKF